MSTTWVRIQGESSGSWANGTRDPRLVLHTTEGTSIEGAVAAYRRNRSWPHVTADPVRRRVAQHLEFDQPARALKNKSTPGETNRDPLVIQLEIVAFAASAHLMDGEDLDWLGEEVIGPMCRTAGVPLTTSLTFHGAGAGWILATSSARQRLSRQAWESYRGILGHQHVPENDHWDPGALDVARIIRAATPGEAMPTDDDARITQLERENRRLAEITSALNHRLEQVERENRRLAEISAALAKRINAGRG